MDSALIRRSCHHDHVGEATHLQFAKKCVASAHPWLMKGTVVVEAVLWPEVETARIVELAFDDPVLKDQAKVGVLAAVLGELRQADINVEEMETQVVPAPMSASPLFEMKARIKVPPQLSLADLDANLQGIGEELGVDIEVIPCQD